ncbi:L-serine ammonia-lyase, iron-sulfur-dependent subunit beta [Anaerosporobacter faecicola]|uniref:L-serine ammonia-lyase, iron-sulfur-dependent subunit beta n=1 Tax=Anaerosporobacter faecicola TaxID=2718714 RepID=UPI001439FE79|nr:L-serine ammonia-lyase, iron-sulfur-dependent subunit beta [Anaerosporobacter faecicola]
MDVSIFEVVGPIMIGPSSSHTAGAAKLARIARNIVDEPFKKVRFGLHGSFAMTYKGHGTDRALVAGALGLYEDDEALAESFELAKQQGLSYEFYPIQLENVHENTVKMTFVLLDDREYEVIGSSIGGGQILITSINGFHTEFTAQYSTIIINHYDKKGIVSEVSAILANNRINIATMRLSRNARGEEAFCIIETDDVIPLHVKESIEELENILHVQLINVTPDL